MIESTATAMDASGGAAARGGVAKNVRVVAVVVTWNRLGDVQRVLKRLGAMDTGGASLHAVVLDNASDDGTAEAIVERWTPERVVSNSSAIGSRPAFEVAATGRSNGLGLGSLTVVRNSGNLGGCGGFNTGLSAVSELFGRAGSDDGPDFVWLLDDDIDLPTDALGRLRRAAALDPGIALVGSRTVDRGDRQTTIESTIYYDRTTGMMGPKQDGESESLREAVEGVRDVDIVSACSMLVRWAAVEGIGFWDDRFFIYCDDADWCLRIKRAGWRVVCALDAVVYHTPWTHKLTPARGYYLHRNLLWMNAKHLEGADLRRVWLRWSWRLLRQAKSAALNRRMTEAMLTVRAVSDAVRGAGGKLEFEAERCGLVEALGRVGALGGEAVVLASGRAGFDAAERVRAAVTNELIAGGRSADAPRWRIVLEERAASAAHGGDAPMAGSARTATVCYRPTRLGKLRAQRAFLRRRPDAVIVIDEACEFPLLVGRATVHVSSDDLSRVTIEPGGLGAVASFGVAWLRTMVRTVARGAMIRRDTRSDPRPHSVAAG